MTLLSLDDEEEESLTIQLSLRAALDSKAFEYASEEGWSGGMRGRVGGVRDEEEAQEIKVLGKGPKVVRVVFAAVSELRLESGKVLRG